MVQAINKTQAEWQEIFDQMEDYIGIINRLVSDRTIYNATAGSYRQAVISNLTGTVAEFNARVAIESELQAVADAFESSRDGVKSVFESDFVKTVLKAFLATAEDDVGEGDETSDTSNNILAEYDGILGNLRAQMYNACTGSADVSRLSNWQINGRIKGTNTTTDGTLYVHFTTSGGYYVLLYKHANLLATDCVGYVSGGATSAATAATIYASNGSGISGSVNYDWLGSSDNSTVKMQSVLECTVAASSVYKLGDNTGKLTFSNVSALQSAHNGDTVEIECISNTLGAETFSVVSEDVPDGGAFNATIHQNYISLDVGLSFTMTRDYDVTGSSASDVTVSSITNENATNCPAGAYYGTITTSGALSVISLYKEVGHSNLVALGSVTTTAGGTVTLTAQNGGPTATLVIGANPSAGNFVIDLNQPAVGDKWIIELTNDEAGFYAWFFARYYQILLNTATSGNQTITEPA